MSNTKGKRIYLYRLSPTTFGYTLLRCLQVTADTGIHSQSGKPPDTSQEIRRR